MLIHKEVENWALPLGCEPSNLPFRNKLSRWKSKTLSFGGRVTLAKAVLGNLPIFYLSVFAAPLGIIEALERIRRKFIWGGPENESKINWVAWDKILAPKEVGGLGLGSIKAMNLALLTKWKWKFFTERDLLWVKIINGLHNLGSFPPSKMSSRYISRWILEKILINAIILFGN